MAGNDRETAERPGGRLADLRRGKARALHHRKRRFLRALEQTNDVRAAATAADVGMRSVARWRADDPVFRDEFQAIDGEIVLRAETRLRDLVDSPNERTSLRACIYVLSRRAPGRWGPRAELAAEATAEEIAAAILKFQADVEASVPGPPSEDGEAGPRDGPR